tara:strand:+ start:41 stop:880 length:840 start_codon:yes stop_codon:yes gene_type:complete
MKFFIRFLKVIKFISFRKYLEITYLTKLYLYKLIHYRKIVSPNTFASEWSNSLCKEGFYLGSFFDLNDKEVNELENEISSYFDLWHQKKTKKFFKVFDLKDITINRILKLISKRDTNFFDFTNAYCSGEAVLHSAQYIISNHESDLLKSSQLFHKDYASSATFKLFIYLSDVENSSNGPFTFLLPFKESLYRKIRFFSIHKPPTWESLITKDKKIEVLGKRGKVFLIDTYKLFHCGSRVDKNSKERRVIILTFRFKNLMSGTESWQNWTPKYLNDYTQI